MAIEEVYSEVPNDLIFSPCGELSRSILECWCSTPLGGQPSSWEEMRNLLFDDSSTSLSCLDEGVALAYFKLVILNIARKCFYFYHLVESMSVLTASW